MNNVLKTFSLCVFITGLLKLFPNNSNFSDYLLITLIASLSVKYILGDWDLGYSWTKNDIFYWLTLIISSILTIKIINAYNVFLEQENR